MLLLEPRLVHCRSSQATKELDAEPGKVSFPALFMSSLLHSNPCFQATVYMYLLPGSSYENPGNKTIHVFQCKIICSSFYIYMYNENVFILDSLFDFLAYFTSAC